MQLKFRYKKLLAKFNFGNYAFIPISCLVICVLFTINFLYPRFNMNDTYAKGVAIAANDAENCTIYKPTAYLSVSGQDDDVATEAGYNNIAYRTYEVNAKTCNAQDYSLGISGPNVLTTEDNSNSIPAVATDNSDLTDNRWGYYYDKDGTGLANARFNNLRTAPDGTEGFGTETNKIWSMQEMTADFCKSLPIGTKGSLYDERDDKIYTVQKIRYNASDDASLGSYWMTQNLALDINETNENELNESKEPVGLNKDNTDMAADSLSKLDPATYTKFTTESDFKDWASAQSNWQLRRYGVLSKNMPSSTGNISYQTDFGYYYSWCAATLGCKNASGQTETSFVGGDAIASICPKGWRLPSTNNSGNDFTKALGGASNYSTTLTPFISTDISNAVPGYLFDSTNGVRWLLDI